MHLQVIYFKKKKRGSKWQAIITTDKNLSAQKAYKVYQTRWAIESSYKELKQLLSFGKCMSRDFDAQICDATQTLLCYNVLSHTKAINDYQSIGMLFKEASSQWLKPTLMKRFWNSIYEVIKKMAELLVKPIDELIDLVINDSQFNATIFNLNSILSTET